MVHKDYRVICSVCDLSVASIVYISVVRNWSYLPTVRYRSYSGVIEVICLQCDTGNTRRSLRFIWFYRIIVQLWIYRNKKKCFTVILVFCLKLDYLALV